MTVKFKKIFLILFFIIISLDKANAITFTFNELSNCVENYGSFKQFKNNFKTCYERKNVILNEEAINKIESKKNILNKLIEKDINKLLDTNASPDDIFSQPSVFSPDYLTGKYYLDNNSLTIIEEYASKNPTYIYGITEDINVLAYEDQFISLKQRKELLLNIYNSFDVGLLLKAPKKITKLDTIKPPKKITKLETSKDIPKKIIKKETVVKKSKPTFLEKLKELTKRDKNKKTPKVKTKQVVLSSDKKKDKKKKKKIEIIKTNPRLIYLLPVVALAAAASSEGGSGNSTPTLSYSVSSASLGECDSAATFTGILTSAHSSNVTVSITTSGTATDGTDYNLSSTTLTINSGSTTGSVSITPVNDTTAETSETVILSASVTSGGVSVTGSSDATVTLYDYVLKCNSTAYTEDTSVQNTIVNKTQWTNIDTDTDVHPYEQMNVHKAQSFKSGSTYLTGEGETIHIADFNCDDDHDIFNNKTITNLDDGDAGESTFDAATSVSTEHHCQMVATFAAGDSTGNAGAGESTHMGVAPDADIILSSIPNFQGTNEADDYAADLDSARAGGAVASNNSWAWGDNTDGNANANYNVSEAATSMTNNSRTIQEELAQLFHGSTSGQALTDINTYITALDNFQSSGVIVFAGGNYNGESDTSVMSGLPYWFDGVKNSTDLSDAWIAVNVTDFTGTSISGASESDFTLQGNKCGSAAAYCLTVDGYDVGGATYINSGTSQYTTDGWGSSYSAPMVSGGIALLAQAFPNHTPEQLTDRLLASAANDWFTPTGNTTFTTHGASIKHGYHGTWGHGVPDFYAALSPITTSANPAGAFSVGSSLQNSSSTPGSQIPVHITSLTQSSSMGDAIYKGLKGTTTYLYDALNGGFKFDLSNLVTSVSPEDQKIEIDFAEELNVLRNLDISNDKFSKKNGYQGEFVNFTDASGYGLSLTLSQPNIALQNFNLYNNQYYKNPFTSYTKGLGLNNKFDLLGNSVFLGYHNSSIDPLRNTTNEKIIPTETLALSINFDNKNFDLLSFTGGVLKEKNTFLFSEGFGALDMSDESSFSNFYGINLNKDFDRFGNIYFNSLISFSSSGNKKNSFIADTSEVLSSSFEMNYEYKNLIKNDILNISLSQPNKVEKGDMTFRLTGLADKYGNLPYTDHVISLSPSGRQKDLSIGYYNKISEIFKTGIKTIITDDLGHRKNDNLDANILFSSSYIF
jgi:hypothetical protein